METPGAETDRDTVRGERRHRASSEYLSGARAASPFVAAVGLLGVVLGSLSVATGLSPAAAVLLSATAFAGSAQFAALAVVGDGGTIAAAAAAAALLVSRYLVMGAAASHALGAAPWRRALLGQLAVDESWAVAYRGDGRFSRERLVGAAIALYVAHVSATAIGALGGALIDPERLGLDAVFPALFLVILWPFLARREARVVAVVGGAIALVLVPTAPAGVPVSAAAMAALVGVRPRQRR